MSIILDRIPLDLIERFWPHVEPHLTAACNAVTTSLTPDEIKASALADRRGLWVAIDTEATAFPILAAASVGLRQTNHGPVFFIEAVGGRDGKRWIRACLAELEQHAKGAGAVKIEIEGRRGWRRMLPEYREARVVLERVL
jgi:hypothetical protein